MKHVNKEDTNQQSTKNEVNKNKQKEIITIGWFATP